MTTRASITVSTNRAPPRRRHMPDRPPDGYHVTESEPVSTDLSTLDHRNEITQSLSRIEELDIDMIAIDGRIDHYQETLTDPSADGWDRIDAEGKVGPLPEERERLRGQRLQHAGHIAACGFYLIEGWREHELDNIGKELSTIDGPLAAILSECPGIETHATYVRLEAAACPF